jgi:hypothetical protein
MWRDFSRAVRDLKRVFGTGTGIDGGSYRPDLHYMRGPGPKWHAKYGHLVPKTEANGSASHRAVGEIAEHRA